MIAAIYINYKFPISIVNCSDILKNIFSELFSIINLANDADYIKKAFSSNLIARLREGIFYLCEIELLNQVETNA